MPQIVRLYTADDWKREKIVPPKAGLDEERYRKPWRRDYARILHSPAFRRLQGKTQLFPNNESDFFRNRLTHSLEVAQIAKSIAIKLNHTDPAIVGKSDREFRIKYDVCELSALAHDIGHPPFGHVGERALNERMKDCGGFEGNAQTLRILAKLEKRDKADEADEIGLSESGEDLRLGLNLAYRSLASVIKYCKEIPQVQENYSQDSKVSQGYYGTEAELVRRINQHVAPDTPMVNFKTIECSIMDIADDIAYSTYDLEDALKANFTSPLDMISLDSQLVEQIEKELNGTFDAQGIKDALYEVFKEGFARDSTSDDIEWLSAKSYFSKGIVNDGYERSKLTSYLISRAIQNTHIEETGNSPATWRAVVDPEYRRTVDLLKKFSYVVLINSSMIKIVEARGKDIVWKIFDAIKQSAGTRSNLLPRDHRMLFERVPETHRDRVICDFIAGMTDRYALEFYGRLYSERPQTIFKPL